MSSNIDKMIDGARAKRDTFTGRMEIELAELQERIDRLGAFLDTDKFKDLDKDRRHLLGEQHAAMIAYRDILQMRLDLESGNGD